jgi:uncharacterized protein
VSDAPLGPGPRTTVRRLPEKARYDAATVHAILDEALVAHVAATVQGRAVALPTLVVRDGATLYLHGSRSNAVLASVVEAREAWVTATLLDGLRLARSGFESSVAYRSVVVVGAAREVAGDEKDRALELLVDRVAPGRSREVRPASDRERALTRVVAVAIDEASAKVSSGPTDDEPADLDRPIWAGTVPIRTIYGEPVPDRRGALADDRLASALPASVRALLDPA